MTALALASMFTGAVVFIWGIRAIRNKQVKVLFFKMRSWTSTMIFGIVSMFSGLLMIIAGPAATSLLTAELADLMARVALYLFGVGWVIALVLEGLAHIGWRISPADAPPELRERENASHRKRQKRNPGSQEDNSGACLISSARRQLQTAVKLTLLGGSRLYHRVMLPPRSWDKQNLWHGDGEHKTLNSGKPGETAESANDALIRESRSANEEPVIPKVADHQ